MALLTPPSTLLPNRLKPPKKPPFLAGLPFGLPVAAFLTGFPLLPIGVFLPPAAGLLPLLLIGDFLFRTVFLRFTGLLAALLPAPAFLPPAALLPGVFLPLRLRDDDAFPRLFVLVLGPLRPRLFLNVRFLADVAPPRPIGFLLTGLFLPTGAFFAPGPFFTALPLPAFGPAFLVAGFLAPGLFAAGLFLATGYFLRRRTGWAESSEK